MALFRDRTDAGRELAKNLSGYADNTDVIVLALPRGGIPVGFQVAKRLNVPLDVFLVRKLGVPGHEELAMGAIASGGTRVMNENVLSMLRISDDELDEITAREQQELERRERAYRGDRPEIELADRIVILVDDGLATGASMRAAVSAIRARNPARIVVAVPVAAPETCREFENEVDEVVCATTPEPFYAVGAWYEDFSQTTDEEVKAFLEKAANSLPDA